MDYAGFQFLREQNPDEFVLMKKPRTVFRLNLPGYVPPSQNRVNGRAFYVLNKEKKRAHDALRSALSSAAADPAIGTTTGSKDFRTLSSTLESFLTTAGKSWAGGASKRSRFTGRKTKA